VLGAAEAQTRGTRLPLMREPTRTGCAKRPLRGVALREVGRLQRLLLLQRNWCPHERVTGLTAVRASGSIADQGR